jgi:methionyl-tRNA synthetase
MDSTVPARGEYNDESLENHKQQSRQLLATYIEHLEATKLRAGVIDILNYSALGNKLLQDNKLDGKLLEEQPARCNGVISIALSHIHLLASLLSPYMPEVSASIFRQLDLPNDPIIPDADSFGFDSVPAGHEIGTPAPLFSRIPSSNLEEWKKVYGGEELRRQKTLQAEKAAAKKAKKLKVKETKKAQKGSEGAAAGESVEANVAELSLQKGKEE